MRRLGLALNLTDFSPVEDAQHAELKVQILYSILCPILDRLLPLKKGKVTSQDKAWITPRIKGLIAERQKAFMSGDTSGYNKLRDKVQYCLKRAKRSFFKKEVAQMKPGGTHWFSTVKALIGASKPRGNSMPATAADTSAQCESFSKHFASVWSSVHRVIPSPMEVADQLSHRTIPELSIGQVKAQLKRVNPRKGTGGDHIPPWVLSNFHEELAPVMCNIYNACLQQGVFPMEWKEELVVPVPKTPKPKGPEEFRRISLTSSFGKVLEVFLRDLLLQDTNHLIHDSQHGFRRGRSTVSALI
ncbi:Hypp2921 [Branchiostoma lanceolatum]|uniref:Hypp2921 protein n=1 Tax=Branchiostoma lanceolatum TaxID=7740 RepID=A0A8J9ZXW7_BRALA|nr:Hypp2921 [Branchiostoma lanceolatum]